MNFKRLLAILLAAIMLFAVCACQTGGNDNKQEDKTLAGTYDITVWVGENAVELTQKQIDDFNKSNEFGITFTATVAPVSEATSADTMLKDVSVGADIYSFAQDQFARLVQGGALNKLGAEASKTVTENNDAGVVAAATSGDQLYAYPMTSDNGYFMYYDKSVISDEDVDSLEKLIAACEKANKYFAFEMNTSAWYLASFFFATGCVSEWKTADDGTFESVHDTFNSPEGLIAVKGMKKLVDSPMHLSSSAASEFASDAAIVVTGTWAYDDIKALLGDRMGVADLPSFNVDGKDYHLGSFNGCKLLGVKPQTDATRAAALHKLAQYLTDEERQMERFNAITWGPSNKNVQASDAVKANPGLAALLQQNQYSIPQGQIHGSWWDIAKVIADDVKAATDDAGLQKALDNYYDKINALFKMTDDEKNAWGVIGMYNTTDGFFVTDYSDGAPSNWTDEAPMTEAEAGVWKTTQAYELPEGCEFKVRQGHSWEVAYPADNFKVETAGTYYIQLVVETGEVTLVAA